MTKTVYVCEDCGSVILSPTWCPKHPYAILDEVEVEVENEETE